MERWSRSGRTERRRADRARLVLGAAEGQGTRAIARQLHVRAATVSKWCSRFRTHGLAGLRDRARPGAPVKYAETTQRILRQLDAPPPPGYARWNGRLVAEALGDVPADGLVKKFKDAVDAENPFDEAFGLRAHPNGKKKRTWFAVGQKPGTGFELREFAWDLIQMGKDHQFPVPVPDRMVDSKGTPKKKAAPNRKAKKIAKPAKAQLAGLSRS